MSERSFDAAVGMEETGVFRSPLVIEPKERMRFSGLVDLDASLGETSDGQAGWAHRVWPSWGGS